MTPRKTRYSLPRFFDFLETVWQEKLVKKSTLKRWQDAIVEFQQVMCEDEVTDMRSIDVKSIGARYVSRLVDQRSSITPWRIFHLKRALAQSIGEFVAFTINPNEYERTTRLNLAKQAYLQNKAQAATSAVVALPTLRSRVRVSAAAR